MFRKLLLKVYYTFGLKNYLLDNGYNFSFGNLIKIAIIAIMAILNKII